MTIDYSPSFAMIYNAVIDRPSPEKEVYLPTPVFQSVMDFVGDLTKEKQKKNKKQTMEELDSYWDMCELADRDEVKEKYGDDFYVYWNEWMRFDNNPGRDYLVWYMEDYDDIRTENFYGNFPLWGKYID